LNYRFKEPLNLSFDKRVLKEEKIVITVPTIVGRSNIKTFFLGSFCLLSLAMKVLYFVLL
jgi:hypothetical protein